MLKMFGFVKKNKVEIILIVFSLVLSFWLMFSTFSYSNGSLLIASKTWSDFASHIPLIRSFSFGDNFPPQYPIFPGEPIRYHFLFYLLAGLLEKIGLRIDFALNIPSALSFSVLLIIIYFLAKNLFKNKIVGLLSVLFFLFNSSLSFFDFFKTHKLSLKTINEIIQNTTFPSFGPYDGKIVSAFWNLNIYTNQRHLALSLALLFLIVYFLIKNKPKQKRATTILIIALALIIGILPFLHSAVFLMSILVLGMLFLFLSNQRLNIFLILFIGILISLPRIIFLKQTSGYTPHLEIGYLIANNFSFLNFINYWFINLGISFILIPVGFFLSSKQAKKIFLSFLLLFIIGNLFQFSPEMAGNHKFFNTFLIIGNIYSAFALVKIWQNKILKNFVPLILFFMIFSGIIDFFPIKNDSFISFSDYPKNPDIQWIKKNTSRDSIFLNSSYLYNPASFAGRKIFLGWPYFSWSLGYDTNTRDQIRKKLFTTNNIVFFCNKTKEYKIKYIIIDNQTPDFSINEEFLGNYFSKSYENISNKIRIYEIQNC